MYRYLIGLFFLFMLCVCSSTHAKSREPTGNFYSGDNPYMQYVGRGDFTNPAHPRFWAPGAYLKANFNGTFCKVIINDEVLWGASHNYLEVVVDDKPPVRIQTKNKTDTLNLATGLSNGNHSIVVCKNTEANIGYIEFAGILCTKLLAPAPLPRRKIEFVGNSITSGTGMDQSVVPCHTGLWYDHHNAYMSYGATTARNLNAQWHLTSVSGIGLMQSCCKLEWVIGNVYDKVNLRANTIKYDFKLYQPDVITLCIGQNDGLQDSAKFCANYLEFIRQVRVYSPGADIVCLTSPMADEALTAFLKKSITAIVQRANAAGDKKVSGYFFRKRYNSGCDGHPDMPEHQKIANELTAYIKTVEQW